MGLGVRHLTHGERGKPRGRIINLFDLKSDLDHQVEDFIKRFLGGEVAFKP
jgi:hypothetical protein